MCAYFCKESAKKNQLLGAWTFKGFCSLVFAGSAMEGYFLGNLAKGRTLDLFMPLCKCWGHQTMWSLLLPPQCPPGASKTSTSWVKWLEDLGRKARIAAVLVNGIKISLVIQVPIPLPSIISVSESSFFSESLWFCLSLSLPFLPWLICPNSSRSSSSPLSSPSDRSSSLLINVLSFGCVFLFHLYYYCQNDIT